MSEAEQGLVMQRDPASMHVYLSTACLHMHHDYCKNAGGQMGPKKPAECKFCHAKCICDCHTGTP